MAEQKVTICNKLGLHARASARFAETASRFSAQISLKRGDIRVNGKSIMGLLMLAAARGSELTIEAIGSDAEPALQALADLVADRFGEGE